MKKTYNKTYAERNPRATFKRTMRNLVRNRRAIGVCLIILLALLFVLSCFLTYSDAQLTSAAVVKSKKFAGAQGTPPPKPGVYAEGAILMDADSGRVLYEKNAHTKYSIASTTKMITALVVRKKLKLTDQVVISPAAAAVGEQGIWLTAGESISVQDLLYALLVQSANDAAYALAEKASGSAAAFAQDMNAEAKELGAVESSFKNPHGLDQAGHYSTAYDLAIIGRKLMQDPVLAGIVTTKSHEIPWAGHPGGRIALNHDEFLGQYPGATGIKTGYTLQAGWCLVGSATRNGKTFIAVALNSAHRAADVSAMMDYGFAATGDVVFLQKGQEVGLTRVSNVPRRYVRAVAPEKVSSSSVKGAGDDFKLKVSVARKAGRVKKGQSLGIAQCYLNGKLLFSSKIIAATSGESSGPFATVVFFLWYALCWLGKIVFAPFRIF